MPPIETVDRHDPAIYWARSAVAYGYDNYGNEIATWSSYTEIYTRWEEQRGEIRDTHTGQLVDYDVVCVVNEEIEKGSRLWKGSEEEYLSDVGTDGIETGDTIQDIMIVVERGHIPDIKGRNIRRVIYLRRDTDQDPSIRS